MGHPLKIQYITPDEYLAGEMQANIRHEYVDGEVFAMAGASEQHNRISGNIFFQLRAAARGTSCGIFINDMKIRIRQSERFYYPDISVCCERNDNEIYFKHSPCLIAEVLSHSTANTDRREKWLVYREIPQLRYYLLVSSRKAQVEYFQRTDAGSAWETGCLEPNETLEINCGEYRAALCLADIFEDVAW